MTGGTVRSLEMSCRESAIHNEAKQAVFVLAGQVEKGRGLRSIGAMGELAKGGSIRLTFAPHSSENA